MTWEELRDRLQELSPLLVAFVLLSISPVGWREGAAAGALCLLALFLRDRQGAALALALGFANLAGAAHARGSEPARLIVLLLGVALIAALIVSPGRWPWRLLPAVGIGGALTVALPFIASALAKLPMDRAVGLTRWPGTVAAFVATLLFFSRDREAGPPRWVLAGCLGVACVLGIARLVEAREALDSARQSAALEPMERAAEQARAAGWSRGEREARLLQARTLLKGHEPQRALERLTPEVASEPEGQLLRGEVLLALGKPNQAMDLFRRALADLPHGPDDLSPAAEARIGLWESRYRRFEAAARHLTVLSGVAEPERYLAEYASVVARMKGDPAPARALLERALRTSPGHGALLCAVVELGGSAENQRRCLAVAPTYQPPQLALQRADELPAIDVSFGGVIRLRSGRVTRTQARRGEVVPLEFNWEVESICAPDERYTVFVHFDGPGHFGADHLIDNVRDSPSWIRGERFRYGTTPTIPLELPPGRYAVHVGLYNPDSQARLRPTNGPGHLQFIDLGSVEVLP